MRKKMKNFPTALKVRNDLLTQSYGVDRRKSSTLRSKSTGAESSAHTSPNNQLTSVHSRNSATGEITMINQSANRHNLDHSVTRRKFLGTTALSSAALLSGGLASLLQRSASAAGDFDFVEKSILELQAAMASGQLTSKQLVMGYLDRIQSLNPLLHSVIETNPDALSIAERLDDERRSGHVRGPLHGIPKIGRASC